MLIPGSPAYLDHFYGTEPIFADLPDGRCRWGWRYFDTYPVTSIAAWPPGGGVYILARHEREPAEILDGRPAKATALYVGETKNFSARLGPLHEKWFDALIQGMTHAHVWAMPYATNADRLELERELREEFRPVLNPPPLRAPAPAPLPWFRW